MAINGVVCWEGLGPFLDEYLLGEATPAVALLVPMGDESVLSGWVTKADDISQIAAGSYSPDNLPTALTAGYNLLTDLVELVFEDVVWVNDTTDTITILGFALFFNATGPELLLAYFEFDDELDVVPGAQIPFVPILGFGPC